MVGVVKTLDMTGLARRWNSLGEVLGAPPVDNTCSPVCLDQQWDLYDPPDPPVFIVQNSEPPESRPKLVRLFETFKGFSELLDLTS